MSEVDAMICRVCGKEERASEGYPCDNCGDFICLICSFEGITLCKACAESAPARAATKAERAAADGGSDGKSGDATSAENDDGSAGDPPEGSAANDNDEGAANVT